MSWLKDLFGTSATKVLKKPAEQAVGNELRRVLGDRRVPGLIARETRRQTDRWMTEELGLPVTTRYRDVYQFVDEFLVEFYAVPTSQSVKWCDHWWEHPAAVRRLTLMWASWERHRADNPATGEEVWARVVGDYHFRWLTGTYSPFTRCSSTHKLSEPLRSAPIPVDL